MLPTERISYSPITERPALKLPDVRTKFLDQGAEPVGQDTAATAAFIRDEERRWREVIKSANVTLE